MKHRDGIDLGGDRLSDQGRSMKGKAGTSSSTMVEGKYDSYWIGPKAMWFHITPHQAWKHWTWDKDSREMIEVVRTWLQYTMHFYATTKKKTVCSSGPLRDQPCFGDAIKRAHEEKLDDIKKRTGVRPSDESAVGYSNQYAFSIVMMEPIVVVQPLDKTTRAPRLSRSGNPIYNYRLEHQVYVDDTIISKTWGHRFHMSLGKTALEQIFTFDEEMKNYCKYCATPLAAENLICPDCEVRYPLSESVTGEDLSAVRQSVLTCTCGYEGQMQPELMCSGCGNAEEGRLTDFDIRVKKEKTSEKSSILKIVGIRKPLSTLKDDERKVEVQKMIENPLDLYAIFAPTSLEEQKNIFGQLTTGLDPRPVKRGEATDVENYAKAGEAAEDISY